MTDTVNIFEDTQETIKKNNYLIFLLDNNTYGLETTYITEIIGIQTITEVPLTPTFVKGVINLRGLIIPLIDVRLRINKQYKEYNEKTCIIILDKDGMLIGLIVDKVIEVLNINDDNIIKPPKGENSYNNKYVTSIGKVGNKINLLIDVDKLIKYEHV